LPSGVPRLFHRSGERPRPVEIAGNYAEIVDAAEVRGSVLLLHRGAWSGAGPENVRRLRPVARRFQGWGWSTLNASYRNGPDGFHDVVAAFEWAGERWGAPPTCVYGESSGGHWALMLASRGQATELTVVAAAPTDLVSWASMLDGEARDYVRGLLHSVFGDAEHELERLSPARQPWQQAAAGRLLLVYGEEDPLVPPAHGERLLAAAPAASLMTLPAGDLPWIHLVDGRGVDPTALESTFSRIRRRLEELV
jgi:acetyl esterase/lipase